MTNINLELDFAAASIALAAFGFAVTFANGDLPIPQLAIDAMQKVRYAYEGLDEGKGDRAHISFTNDEVWAIHGLLLTFNLGYTLGRVNLDDDQAETLAEMIAAHEDL